MRVATATLILCVSGLMALGMVMLYSSSMAQNGAHYLMLQALWAGAGVIACTLVAGQDYRKLKTWAWVILAIAIILLGLVLIPGIGVYRNGSRRWLYLGFSYFQPSEAAKVALIIALAWYGEKYQRHIRTFWRGLVVPGLIALAVLLLIFVEPDRGTAILLGAVTLCVLLLAGVRCLYVIPPAILSISFLAWSLYNDPVRMRRILSWLYPEEHKTAGGYQAWQAMLAFGAGGPAGVGLGNGRQKLGFVPEHHTDFILSVIGEEMGLIATIGVLIAFIVFLVCGTCIAWNSRDVFGLLLGGGITFLIALQAFINIGVVTSALPNKGLPLPFISYGGSSLMIMLICVGILISIARHGGRDGVTLDEPKVQSPEFS